MASTTGLSVIVSPSNEVYPNPVKNELHIGGVSEQTEYKILSAVGAVLQQGRLQPGNNSIDVTVLPAGIYTLRIFSPGKQFSNFQIIKFSN